MGLIRDPLKPLLDRALAFQSLRQSVIASNIANANTPGFKAFDLVLRDRLEGLKPLQPTRSHPLHMSASESLNRLGAEVVRSRAAARPDGNNVSLDQEMLKLMENRMRYVATFELMDRWGALGRYAREVR